MSKQEETRICLNCKFSTCHGADNCPNRAGFKLSTCRGPDKNPGLKVGSSRKSIKVSLLRDLLLAGYDPAEICFAVVEGTALV